MARKKGKRDETKKFQIGCPHRIGTEMLTEARWFELQNQERSKDKVHSCLVCRMYHGGDIKTEDLQRYQILDPADFDPSNLDASWYDVPYIVSSNRERYTLMHAAAQRFARAHNKVVVRWLSFRSRWRQRPAEQFRAAALRDPCFYEYFVPDALGYFKDDGVSKRLGLVNSLPFRYHSLVPQSEDEEVYNRVLREAQAGEIITLPNPPRIVNITINKDVQEHFSEEQLQIIKERSIDPEAIVLPIRPGGTKEKEDIPIPGGPGYEPSRVTIRGLFPLDPGFSMTVHKAEGRTMERVILCLSHHGEAKTNWDRRGIYVAFSRVQRACDIRLLLHGRTSMEKWMSISYIVDLYKDCTAKSFFAGYGRKSGAPHNRSWKTNEWDGRRSYNTYAKMVEQSD